MKTAIGILALGIWIWVCHPEWIPAIVILGGVILFLLFLFACFCYGVEMLRLFFKI